MRINVAVAGVKGRMSGQVVSSILESENMALVAGFDIHGVGEAIAPGIEISSPDSIDKVLKEVSRPDVFVDFTNAAAAVENVKVAARNNVKIVLGTTGFSDEQFKELESAIKGNVPAIISPNFSIGVNVFWNLIAAAAKHLQAYQYHMEIIEMHHSHKKDAPSGTAVKAAEILADYVKGKTTFVYGRQGITGERTDDELGIHAIRAGDIVGEHTVLYAGKGERLEITHRAHSRDAFAQGAIKAIEWINAKERNGIYSMADMMRELEQG